MDRHCETFTRAMLEERIAYIARYADLKSWVLVEKIANRSVDLMQRASYIEGFGGGRECAFYESCFYTCKTFAQQKKKDQVLYICGSMLAKLNRGSQCIKKRMRMHLHESNKDIGTLGDLPADIICTIASMV